MRRAFEIFWRWPGRFGAGLVLVMLLGGCAREVAGFSRGERLEIYGVVLDAAGHAELGGLVALAGRRLDETDGRRAGKGGKAPREVMP